MCRSTLQQVHTRLWTHATSRRRGRPIAWLAPSLYLALISCAAQTNSEYGQTDQSAKNRPTSGCRAITELCLSNGNCSFGTGRVLAAGEGFSLIPNGRLYNTVRFVNADGFKMCLYQQRDFQQLFSTTASALGIGHDPVPYSGKCMSAETPCPNYEGSSPIITGPESSSHTRGDDIELTYAVAQSSPVSWSVSGLPFGISKEVDGNRLRITSRSYPTSAGTYTIDVLAKDAIDGAALNTDLELTLEILECPTTPNCDNLCGRQASGCGFEVNCGRCSAPPPPPPPTGPGACIHSYQNDTDASLCPDCGDLWRGGVDSVDACIATFGEFVARCPPGATSKALLFVAEGGTNEYTILKFDQQCPSSD